VTALGDDATVPKILITCHVIRVGKGLTLTRGEVLAPLPIWQALLFLHEALERKANQWKRTRPLGRRGTLSLHAYGSHGTLHMHMHGILRRRGTTSMHACSLISTARRTCSSHLLVAQVGEKASRFRLRQQEIHVFQNGIQHAEHT